MNPAQSSPHAEFLKVLWEGVFNHIKTFKFQVLQDQRELLTEGP